MSHRAFEAAAREGEKEPITFTVGTFPHTFTVRQPLPLGQLMLASRVMDPKRKGEEAEMAKVRALDDLLKKWIIEEDGDLWDECLGSLSDLSVLSSIVEHIVEETTGRPT